MVRPSASPTFPAGYLTPASSSDLHLTEVAVGFGEVARRFAADPSAVNLSLLHEALAASKEAVLEFAPYQTNTLELLGRAERQVGETIRLQAGLPLGAPMIERLKSVQQEVVSALDTVLLRALDGRAAPVLSLERVRAEVADQAADIARRGTGVDASARAGSPPAQAGYFVPANPAAQAWAAAYGTPTLANPPPGAVLQSPGGLQAGAPYYGVPAMQPMGYASMGGQGAMPYWGAAAPMYGAASTNGWGTDVQRNGMWGAPGNAALLGLLAAGRYNINQWPAYNWWQ